MLVKLTSQWRKRAATFVVVLYAFCLLAPTAALAFNGSLPAHCLTLTDEHQSITEGSGHHGGVNQTKSAPDDHGLPGKCCGLFCVTAAVPSSNLVAEPMIHVSAVALSPVETLPGRNSSRIDRPPRILPSL